MKSDKSSEFLGTRRVHEVGPTSIAFTLTLTYTIYLSVEKGNSHVRAAAQTHSRSLPFDSRISDSDGASRQRKLDFSLNTTLVCAANATATATALQRCSACERAIIGFTLSRACALALAGKRVRRAIYGRDHANPPRGPVFSSLQRARIVRIVRGKVFARAETSIAGGCASCRFLASSLSWLGRERERESG